MVTGAGRSPKGHLFYIRERNKRYEFLVDRGEEVNVLPPDYGHDLLQEPYRQQVPNNTKFNIFDESLYWILTSITILHGGLFWFKTLIKKLGFLSRLIC